MNNIHYYPYASFTNEQMPILKAAAIYFDKLHILDPFQASWKVIGAGPAVQEVAFLEKKNILNPIHPAEVLKKFEHQITASIRADMNDPEFLQLCDSYGKHQRWTLALAKVPIEIREDPKFKPLDQSMKTLMGDFSQEMAAEAGKYQEEYYEYAEINRPYDEYREVLNKDIEYRYVDYPLALGESIMINHALFAGLLHAEATPITDDPFHKKVLEHKIKRAAQIPMVRDVLEDRFRSPKLKNDFFAHYLLTDKEIKLPAMSDKLRLEDIYRFREDHQDDLEQARRKITQLSRAIMEIPLSDGYSKEVDAAMVGVDKELEEAEKARNAWLKSKRGKNALRATGIAVGAAAATLSIVFSVTPLAPIGLAIAGLGLLGDHVIPGFELFTDWKKEKAESLDNGLHYFLELK
jgi:hypothetical protein